MAKAWRNFSLGQAVASVLRLSRRDEATGCLLYEGHRNSKGYGRVALDGHYTSAHRVMFIYANGAIGRSVHVLHRCDIPNCCEPSHLFRGDNAANQIDRVQKGRFTKLRPEDVPRVKEMLAAGISQSAVAAAFGVTQPTISDVNTGRRWGHLLATTSV